MGRGNSTGSAVTAKRRAVNSGDTAEQLQNPAGGELVCDRHGVRPEGETLCQGKIADPYEGIALKCGAKLKRAPYPKISQDRRPIPESAEQILFD